MGILKVLNQLGELLEYNGFGVIFGRYPYI